MMGHDDMKSLCDILLMNTSILNLAKDRHVRTRLHPSGSEVAGELVERAILLLGEATVKYRPSRSSPRQDAEMAELRAARRGAAGLLRAAAAILEEM